MIVIPGVLLIGLGFLVRSFPQLIAGYNTLPAEKKKKVDVKGLSNFMFISFIVMGAVVILVGLLLEAFGLKEVSFMTVFFLILAGAAIMIWGAQRFDHN